MTEHANGGSFACSVDIDAPAQTTEINTPENNTAEVNSAQINSAEVKTEATTASGFARFGFAPELLKALEAIGYLEPSPIQKLSLIHI